MYTVHRPDSKKQTKKKATTLFSKFPQANEQANNKQKKLITKLHKKKKKRKEKNRD